MISLVVISYKIQDQNLDFLQGITTMIPVGVMVSGVAMLCVAMYRMYIIYIYIQDQCMVHLLIYTIEIN